MARDPLYRQIADDLRRQIASGDLAPGRQLPSEVDLTGAYGASRNTVREAIRWLITQGLVTSRPGQGTFVTERPAPFVTVLTAEAKTPCNGVVESPGGGPVEKGQTAVPGKRLLDVRPEVATADIANGLRLSSDEDVIRRRETRVIGDIIWSRQTSYYPSAFVEQGASLLISPRDIDEGTMSYLAAKLGLRESKYRDVIKVRAPELDEARLFGLPEDGRISVFEISRTAYDQNGHPMRLTITVCPTDCNHFVVEVDLSEAPQASSPKD